MLLLRLSASAAFIEKLMPIAILNGTCSFPTVQLQVHNVYQEKSKITCAPVNPIKLNSSTAAGSSDPWKRRLDLPKAIMNFLCPVARGLTILCQVPLPIHPQLRGVTIYAIYSCFLACFIFLSIIKCFSNTSVRFHIFCHTDFDIFPCDSFIQDVLLNLQIKLPKAGRSFAYQKLIIFSTLECLLVLGYQANSSTTMRSIHPGDCRPGLM